MSEKSGRFVYPIFWNCGLITSGTLIQTSPEGSRFGLFAAEDLLTARDSTE